MTSSTSSSGSGGGSATASVALVLFASLLLFLSQTTASGLADDELPSSSLLLLFTPDDAMSLTSSSAALPLALASSFLRSIFPLAASPAGPHAVGNCTETSVASQPACSVEAESVSLLPLSLLWGDQAILVSSVCSFLLLLTFLLFSNDAAYPYMLKGNRPKLPVLPDLSVAPPRLGHRVGSKVGRSLSCVQEGDGSDEEPEQDREGEEEQRRQLREMRFLRHYSIPETEPMQQQREEDWQ